MKIRPVILSGGVGTRLWPLSRRKRPKQFIPLTGGQSLFEETARRLNNDQFFSAPIIVCAQDHRFLVQDILGDAGIEAHNILMEPCLRNTAPAIVAAAMVAQKDDPDAVIMVLPSDHYIPDTEAFEQGVMRAASKVSEGGYVLFGIAPNEPHTGFGYIECGEENADHKGIFAMRGFKEKPDEKTAQSYLDQGGFFWNSGMFLLNVRDFLGDIQAHQPEIFEAVEAALENAYEDMGNTLLDQESFERSPSISIDYAIMEGTDKAHVCPVSYGWSDLGAWDALWDVGEKDADGNVLHGDVVARNSQNSYVRSEGGPLVCASGVKDITIVATDDVVIVTPRGESQQIGDLVKMMGEKQRIEVTEGRKVYRPWGSYETTSEAEGYKTKRIIVKPGKRLSLQKHAKRAEHWVIVKGTARVTLDDQEFDLKENESTYIPVGSVHRLENMQNEDLVLIEVQTGPYLGEDDIVRLEDDFGRERALKAG